MDKSTRGALRRYQDGNLLVPERQHGGGGNGKHSMTIAIFVKKMSIILCEMFILAETKCDWKQ